MRKGDQCAVLFVSMVETEDEKLKPGKISGIKCPQSWSFIVIIIEWKEIDPYRAKLLSDIVSGTTHVIEGINAVTQTLRVNGAEGDSSVTNEFAEV